MSKSKSLPPGNYDHDYIMNNPIPAQCVGCQRRFIDGELFRWFDGEKMREKVCNEAIRAPELENCFCFYCNGKLRPLDPEAYRKRQAEIQKYFIPSDGETYQPPLF